jgi:hypothetical protein
MIRSRIRPRFSIVQLMVMLPLLLVLSACPQKAGDTASLQTVVTETPFSCGSGTTTKTCTFRASTDDLLEMVDIPAEYTVKSIAIPAGLPVTWSLNGIERKIRRVIINLVITDAKGIVLDNFAPVLRLRITVPDPDKNLSFVARPPTLLKWTGQVWKPIPEVGKSSQIPREFEINNWGDPPIAWGD